jgi:hypothetical protein
VRPAEVNVQVQATVPALPCQFQRRRPPIVLAALAMISPAFRRKARDINDRQMICAKLRLAQSRFVQSRLCCSSKSNQRTMKPRFGGALSSAASSPYSRNSKSIWTMTTTAKKNDVDRPPSAVCLPEACNLHCLRHPMTLASISWPDLMLRQTPSTPLAWEEKLLARGVGRSYRMATGPT